MDPLDPKFLQIAEEVRELLRYAYQTSNSVTFPMTGTGSTAMEAALANVIEPGDSVLVGVNGYFGARIGKAATHYGATLHQLTKPWGQIFELEEIQASLERYRPAILALVHGETSTGTEQPLASVGELCHEYGTLLLVDTVSTLGASPLFVDEWGIDICYSASQQCLSAASGLAPLTLSWRAIEKCNQRSKSRANLYMDTMQFEQYWDNGHVYRHSIPSNLIYALREALRMVAEEGLAECWQRHRNNAELLWLGLADLNLKLYVDTKHRLPSLTTVCVPPDADANAVARYLLTHYNIAIAQGLGGLTGQVWRIGLMGFNSRAENVTLLLTALSEALQRAR
jgi:alanine-glyoxylate transaminase/serine-glyoxylate transaminase/serine-pyruvate transaminase